MASTMLEPLTFSRPRLDLAIAGSSRPSLSVRRELGLGFRPRFAGLRVHRASSTGAKIMKADRRSTVVCEIRETASGVPDVNKETWQSHVLECTTPVVVEFWAAWCGPCRVIHPVIEKLAKTYEGKLHCFKVNIDECPYLTSQYHIRSIPTIMIFKDGEKKDAVIGAVPESTLISFLGKYLGK